MRIGGEELEQQVAAGLDEQPLDAARGEALEDPGDRQVAVARPGLDLGRETPGDAPRRASRRAAGSPARPGTTSSSGTSSERLTTTFQGRDCSSGRSASSGSAACGQLRNVAPPTSTASASARSRLIRAWSRALPKNVKRRSRVLMRPSSDTAVLLTTFTATPRLRRAASPRPRVICTPAHSRPCTGGRFLTLTVTWSTSGFFSDDLGERLGDALDEQELAPLHRVDQLAGEPVVDGALEVVGERRVAQRRAVELDLDAQRLRRRALRVGAADPARHLQALEKEHVHQTRSSTQPAHRRQRLGQARRIGAAGLRHVGLAAALAADLLRRRS